MVWVNVACIVLCAYWSITDLVRGHPIQSLVGAVIGAINAAAVLMR